MSTKVTPTNEIIRIKRDKISVGTNTISGKSGDQYIVISPALDVTGYGDTEKEAQKSFEHNLKVFCQDLLNLSPLNLDKELRKMGFKKQLYARKNYSKLSVDGDGVLQGLEGAVVSSFQEAIF